MMLSKRRFSGYLLESAQQTTFPYEHGPFCAWVSNREGYLLGYGRGHSAADSVRLALVDAAHHYRVDHDKLAGLEAEYFGPMGMMATTANANGGQ